jgi:hypothetical protein
MAGFHACRYAAKVGAFGAQGELPFYDEKRVYEHRFGQVQFLDLRIWKYEQYAEAYAFDKVSPEQLSRVAVGQFGEARTFLGRANRIETTERRVSLVRTAVASSIAVAQWNPERVLEIVFDGAIPVFKLRT